MFYFIKKNMRNLFIRQKMLIIIVVFTQIVSVTAILFSYGIINHYNVKNEAVEGKMLELEIRFDESDINAKRFKSVCKELLSCTENKLDYLYVMASCEGHMISCHGGYKDGKVVLCKSHENLKKQLELGGRIFSEDELDNGEKVTIISSNIEESKINLGGDTYKIIGSNLVGGISTSEEDINYTMPFLSLPDKASMYIIKFNLNIPLNEKEHNELSELILTKLDSTAIIPEFEGVNDIENTKTNNTLIVAGIMLIVFSAVNYCIMYRYILEKRKKTFAIYRICGCSRGKGVLMYIVELLGMSMILFGIMVPVYHYAILPRLKEMFEYITDFYCAEKYIMIGCGYLVALFVAYMILIIGIVRKTPLMLSKEGEI